MKDSQNLNNTSTEVSHFPTVIRSSCTCSQKQTGGGNKLQGSPTSSTFGLGFLLLPAEFFLMLFLPQTPENTHAHTAHSCIYHCAYRFIHTTAEDGSHEMISRTSSSNSEKWGSLNRLNSPLIPAVHTQPLFNRYFGSKRQNRSRQRKRKSECSLSGALPSEQRIIIKERQPRLSVPSQAFREK